MKRPDKGIVPANINILTPRLMSVSRMCRLLSVLSLVACAIFNVHAQINVDQVMNIGRNAMYFEDYVLSIQYFNQAIKAKPYLAKPYFYRSIAKLNLEDYRGAEADASKAIELNPFITDAWEVRGVARQNVGDFGGAIADYEHALTLLPYNKQLTFNLAAALTHEKKYGRADSLYTDLLERFPGYENGYLGRARLRIENKDTVGAIADIDKALSIDNNSFNAHVMRADLALTAAGGDRDTAMHHLEQAIRLQPRIGGLYVNRAFLKYNNNDWFGAMDDYDYALELEPYNRMALFNRGLLEMEVSAYDKALVDFSKVLQLDPDDIRARYNRSIIYSEKGMYNEAIEDINKVIAAYPDFPTGYWMRSDYQRRRGDKRSAMADYDKATKLTSKLRPDKKGLVKDTPKGNDNGENNAENNAELEQKMARREFATLLTMDDNTDFRDEYNNSAIRGRVQDRNVSIQLEPMFEIAYYASPSQVGVVSSYIREVSDLNAMRVLPRPVQLSNHVPQFEDPDIIGAHFSSIARLDTLVMRGNVTGAVYMARALDKYTVRDYAGALADIDRALTITPDYIPLLMLKSQSLMHRGETGLSDGTDDTADMPALNRDVRNRALANEIIDILDRIITLSPRNAIGYYNKGVFLAGQGRTEEAIGLFDRAIELKTDFAEAYFNRGYLYLDAGNRNAGIRDLGKAGEYGIVNAYNLIKRMSR